MINSGVFCDDVKKRVTDHRSYIFGPQEIWVQKDFLFLDMR